MAESQAKSEAVGASADDDVVARIPVILHHNKDV